MMDLVEHKQRILPRYLAEPEDVDSAGALCDKKRDGKHGVSVETYQFNSQRWPKTTLAQEAPLWRHTLVFYRPDEISSATALLFVNGGTCNNTVDFARLAAETGALVVDLRDVPNLGLRFDDGVARKGDQLYAYTWSRFLDDPEKNAYWPLSLPMTKAIVKAMDFVQSRMLQDYFISIDHFVVTGLSKRGLATWLAALHDERIAAIVPVVIDILNTQKTMQHIRASYNDQWPQAFADFIQEKIPEKMLAPEFAQLMDLEDPLAYLRGEDSAGYKKRLGVPKYLINASGDDFFTPDCLLFYLDLLPGETQLRLVPNQGHFIDFALVEEALLGYFRAFLQRSVLPQIQWRLNPSGLICEVLTDKQPQGVTLWQAENPQSRDFRLASGIHYVDKTLLGVYRDGFYHYPVQVNPPLQGWKAHFVELQFQDKTHSLMLTTPAFVAAV